MDTQTIQRDSTLEQARNLNTKSMNRHFARCETCKLAGGENARPAALCDIGREFVGLIKLTDKIIRQKESVNG